MIAIVDALYDGEVLRPKEPLHLRPNTIYTITIEDSLTPAATGDAWSVLESLAGSVEAPSDWSSQHDHYLFGAPKREDNAA